MIFGSKLKVNFFILKVGLLFFSAAGESSLDAAGQAIFVRILATASGEKTKSEKMGFSAGEPQGLQRWGEFSPWTLGTILKPQKMSTKLAPGQES